MLVRRTCLRYISLSYTPSVNIQPSGPSSSVSPSFCRCTTLSSTPIALAVTLRHSVLFLSLERTLNSSSSRLVSATVHTNSSHSVPHSLNHPLSFVVASSDLLVFHSIHTSHSASYFPHTHLHSSCTPVILITPVSSSTQSTSHTLVTQTHSPDTVSSTLTYISS